MFDSQYTVRLLYSHSLDGPLSELADVFLPLKTIHYHLWELDQSTVINFSLSDHTTGVKMCDVFC